MSGQQSKISIIHVLTIYVISSTQQMQCWPHTEADCHLKFCNIKHTAHSDNFKFIETKHTDYIITYPPFIDNKNNHPHILYADQDWIRNK